MSRTETYQSLLDRAESPLQTFIILGQLKLLRAQDRDRRRLDERGFASTTGLIAAMVAATLIWACVAKVIAIALGTWLPFGH